MVVIMQINVNLRKILSVQKLCMFLFVRKNLKTLFKNSLMPLKRPMNKNKKRKHICHH